MTRLLPLLVFALQAETITYPRPLLVVAERLQSAWSRPVTYEEPRWRHASDISVEGDPLNLNYAPRMRTVHLPITALSARSRQERLAALQSIVAEFNSANEPLQYRVSETGWGLHLIPVRSKDGKGVGTSVENSLDSPLDLPTATRTFASHIEAIAAELSARAGVTVQASSGVQRFLSSPPPQLRWGKNGPRNARQALVSLLALASAPYSWRLNCMPSTAGINGEFCVLNLAPLTIPEQPPRIPRQ